MCLCFPCTLKLPSAGHCPSAIYPLQEQNVEAGEDRQLEGISMHPDEAEIWGPIFLDGHEVTPEDEKETHHTVPGNSDSNEEEDEDEEESGMTSGGQRGPDSRVSVTRKGPSEHPLSPRRLMPMRPLMGMGVGAESRGARLCVPLHAGHHLQSALPAHRPPQRPDGGDPSLTQDPQALPSGYSLGRSISGSQSSESTEGHMSNPPRLTLPLFLGPLPPRRSWQCLKHPLTSRQ